MLLIQYTLNQTLQNDNSATLAHKASKHATHVSSRLSCVSMAVSCCPSCKLERSFGSWR